MRLRWASCAVSSQCVHTSNGTRFAEMTRMSADIVIGRTLACCVHPSAAWRRLSGSGRALIVGTYFAASYLAVLAVLLAK
jgi:hypothetical protein